MIEEENKNKDSDTKKEKCSWGKSEVLVHRYLRNWQILNFVAGSIVHRMSWYSSASRSLVRRENLGLVQGEIAIEDAFYTVKIVGCPCYLAAFQPDQAPAPCWTRQWLPWEDDVWSTLTSGTR